MEHDFSKMRFEELHNVGVKYSRALKKCETYLIEIIGIINDKRLYLKFNEVNIFNYSEKYFDFNYRKTVTFLDLYNKSKKIPELKNEIKRGEIGYTKLDTIKAALENLSQKRDSSIKLNNVELKNSSQNEINKLIEVAKNSSRKKLEIIARNISPLTESKIPSPAPKFLGNNKIECVVRFSNEDYMIFEKAKNLLSEEFKKNLTIEEAIKILAERLIENKLKQGNKKAQIIVERKTENSVTCPSTQFGEIEIKTSRNTAGCKTELESNSKKIPAKVKDFVFKRDGGKCSCCGKTSKLHFHHLKPVFEGGIHDKNKIILVCSSCHALIHQKLITIYYDGSGKPKFNFINQNINTFTDYLYEQKRNEALNLKILQNKSEDSGIGQGLLF